MTFFKFQTTQETSLHICGEEKLTALCIKHEMNTEPKHFPFFGSTCVMLKSHIQVNTKVQT